MYDYLQQRGEAAEIILVYGAGSMGARMRPWPANREWT